ncbi:AABR07051241.1 [Phodopus roborovskii]|uniref:AABR07051241.1 protein n=1 Tax=Phodopus roborovskii TaxID=109678 RepID=A0AAU9Z9I5_PHORO|nr:AABR07051241.1 [Phodopus roborovskii]
MFSKGLSLRMPMPKPERKNSSPVVTRSHFCEASNSSTAESQMKAWSLLSAEMESKEPHIACSPHPWTPLSLSLYCPTQPGWPFAGLLTCPAQPGWPQLRSHSCAFPCAGTWCSAPPASGSRCPQSSASQLHR